MTRFWTGKCHRGFKHLPVPYTNFSKMHTRLYTNLSKIYTGLYTNSLKMHTRPYTNCENCENRYRSLYQNRENRYSLVSNRRPPRLLIFRKFSTLDILIPTPPPPAYEFWQRVPSKTKATQQNSMHPTKIKTFERNL